MVVFYVSNLNLKKKETNNTCKAIKNVKTCIFESCRFQIKAENQRSNFIWNFFLIFKITDKIKKIDS